MEELQFKSAQQELRLLFIFLDTQISGTYQKHLHQSEHYNSVVNRLLFFYFVHDNFRFHTRSMDLSHFVALEQGPTLNLIQWLQSRSHSANPLRCAQCNMAMDLKEKHVSHIDGFHW